MSRSARFPTQALTLPPAAVALLLLVAGTATAAPEIKTIKPDGTGDYTTLASWWTAVRGSTNPEQWAEVYSGGSVGDFSWSGMTNATTTAAEHPRIYGAPGHRHAGRVPDDPDTVARCGKINVAQANHQVTIEGMYLHAENNSAVSFGTATTGNANGPYTIRQCLLRRTISNNTAGGAIAWTVYQSRSLHLHNNIVIVDGSLGASSTKGVIDIGGNNSIDGTYYHNTIHTALPMAGFRSPNAQVRGTFYNNVATVGGVAFAQRGAVRSHNASSDATADSILGGSDNLVNVVAANQFINMASDWNLSPTTDLLDAGNPSLVLAIDAVGNVRPNGVAADIGALEWFPSADPVFWLRHPVTASETYTGTNELTVVEFRGPVGYTHYQITDSATPPSGGIWRELATDPPATASFPLPAADGPVTLYAWFTNTAEVVDAESLTSTFIYTTVPPVASPHDLEYYMSLSPTTIDTTHLNDGSSSGQYDGEDIGFYSLETTCDGDPDTEPVLPGITLDAPGTYTFRLHAINMAGNSDSQAATVTILPVEPEIATIKPDGTGDYATLQAWWDAVKDSRNPAQWAEVHSGGSVGSLSWSAMPNLVAPNTRADDNAYPMVYAAQGQRHEGRLPDNPDAVARSGRIYVGSENHRVVVEGLYVATTNSIAVEIAPSGTVEGPITLRQCLVRRTITDDTAGPAVYWEFYQTRSLHLHNNILLVDGELSAPSSFAVATFGGNNPYGGTAYHNTIITALPMRGFRSYTVFGRGTFHNNVVLAGGQAFEHIAATASHNAANDDSPVTVLGGTDSLINLVATAQFVGPASDWHYLHTSSLIDAGLPDAVLDVDAVGNPRPNGAAPDIGALEHWPPPMQTLLLIR